MRPYFLFLPVFGVGWGLLGFPPGWGWVIAPLNPAMPVSAGQLIVLATVVIGAYGGLIWLRSNYF